MLNVVRCRWIAMILLIMAAGFLLPGCKTLNKLNPFSKKGDAKADDVVYIPPEDLPAPPDVNDYQESDTPSAIPMEGEDIVSEDIPVSQPLRQEPETGMIADLQTIYFPFDSSSLSEEARATLDQNYQWLQSHPGIHVLIEGHCDERGTVEYNLNLGQRRADSVREYLAAKGLDPSTLHTISYGEERPMVEGTGEDVWAQNRRVQFLVY